MPVGSEIMTGWLAGGLARCLTGRPEDLRRLFVLERIPYPAPLLRAFIKRLRLELDQGGGGLANILLHLGRVSSPLAKRKLVENLIFHWGVRGARTRVRIRNGGQWVPFLVAFSPWMYCNLKCTGCYSGLYSKDGELSEAELDGLLDQCKNLGNYFVVITGGEPFLKKDVLTRLFRKHGDMFFLVFTNGTLIDERLADELAASGNVAPALSVEGYQAETDRRRGAGTQALIDAAMERLRSRGVMFGVSVTYTSENVETVTEDRFVEHYLAKGALFAWYFMFMPVGKDPILELVPRPAQRHLCGKRVAALRKKYPLFMADFWNDGAAVGGCLAGARRYMHVLNSGRVELCVFGHFGVDNVREKSLLEAANSPFFEAFREAFPYNASANLKRPCPLIDNPQVLRDLVDVHMAQQGHEHAEDLVRDPGVMRWVDDYSTEFAALVEPEWLAMIANPESRWYKDKFEYRNLFAFGKKPYTLEGGSSRCLPL